MKKLIFLLTIAAAGWGITSCCDDNDDLPEVDVRVCMSGAIQAELSNCLYINTGSNLKVDSLLVTPTNGHKTVVSIAGYYLAGLPIGATSVSPYAMKIPTGSLSVGLYPLTIRAQVLQNDRAPALLVLRYTVAVQDSVIVTDTITPQPLFPDEISLSFKEI
jgi:hypothetical protein